jgi:DNA-binding transcriptional regulator YiaG
MAEKHPIEVYREQNGLSQEEFGKLVNVEAGTVSRWEQRKRTPRGDDLKNICAVTSIPAGAILGIEHTQAAE